MSIERIFLGGDGPALPRAAAWLADRFAPAGGVWDLDAVTVVTPGARAGRRLLELLVLEAEQRGVALSPPRCVTVGGLPPLVAVPDPAAPQPADELRTQLAWARALASLPADELARLLGRLPDALPELDFPARWALGSRLASVVRELADAGVSPGGVPGRCAEAGLDLRGGSRFSALDALRRAHDAVLAQAGFAEPQALWEAALGAGRVTLPGPVVLLGVVEMPALTARLLRAAPGGGADPPVALIADDPAEADAYEDLGLLRPDRWAGRRLDIESLGGQVVLADRPADQADRVAAAVRTRLSELGQGPDAATVGLGDAALSGTVRRALQDAGLPAREATGRPLDRSEPALLLGALGRFIASRRFDDLAELVRHPRIDAWAQDQARAAGADAASARRAVADFITLLDRYATDHLQQAATADWLGDPARAAPLRALYGALVALLPAEPGETRPLSGWSRPMLGALGHIYGPVRLRAGAPDDLALREALEAIGQALDEQAQLAELGPLDPPVTADQAAALTVARLADRPATPTTTGQAVEVVGFLELPLDDAPVVVVAGVNEGALPAGRIGDPWLPDRVRAVLGLTDSRHRLVRDTLRLRTVLRARPNVLITAGRWSLAGDPLAPSRLLLAGDDTAIVHRVAAFYDPEPAAASAPAEPAPARPSRFLIPPPVLPPEPVSRLPVTAFRDYLACPYRFYLKHVARLETLDGAAVEMDALRFGTLTHDALQALADPDLAGCDDPERLAAALDAALNRHAAARFGRGRRPAVRVQLEQLRDRLRAAAHAQAKLARDGWRPVPGAAEKKIEATLQTPRGPFTLVGRIDRVDEHPEHGYRVLDYKTGDTVKTPAQTHRRTVNGEKQWADLQLPLYRLLTAELKLDGPVELGYFNLPKDAKATGWSPAAWDPAELAEADATRDWVIDQVQRGVFWPPADPPTFDDGLGAICGDLAAGRAELLHASGLAVPPDRRQGDTP